MTAQVAVMEAEKLLQPVNAVPKGKPHLDFYQRIAR